MSGYELRLVGERTMGSGNSGSSEQEVQEAYESFTVGEEGLPGDLYRAAATAKISPDVVEFSYNGKDYRLKGERVVHTVMELSDDVKAGVAAKVDEGKTPQVTVGISATGPTAKDTLEKVCEFLGIEAAEPMKKEA